MRSAICLLWPVVAAAQTFTLQNSHTDASLRGLWAVTDLAVWASGTHGTFLKTTDGGTTWKAAIVRGAEALDFRDVQGTGDGTAYLLSIGPGAQSRVYKTRDDGDHWTLLLTNPDKKGFFDEMAFWNRTHIILVGDPVDGRLVVMTSEDGGKSWQRRRLPPALPSEGVFAASGTGVAVYGDNDAWIGTGGKNAARVYHSTDRGVTWTVAPTPIRADSPAAGVFSLAFSDAYHGIAVGGAYDRPAETTANIAITSDGGRTWTRPDGKPPNGYRSAVAYLTKRKAWIAAGPTGADISYDGGRNWRQFDQGNYNALSLVLSKTGWAAGPHGRIAKFTLE